MIDAKTLEPLALAGYQWEIRKAFEGRGPWIARKSRSTVGPELSVDDVVLMGSLLTLTENRQEAVDAICQAVYVDRVGDAKAQRALRLLKGAGFAIFDREEWRWVMQGRPLPDGQIW